MHNSYVMNNYNFLLCLWNSLINASKQIINDLNNWKKLIDKENYDIWHKKISWSYKIEVVKVITHIVQPPARYAAGTSTHYSINLTLFFYFFVLVVVFRRPHKSLYAKTKLPSNERALQCKSPFKKGHPFPTFGLILIRATEALSIHRFKFWTNDMYIKVGGAFNPKNY